MLLVIREAISNQIPTLIYNLPVYLNYFDKFKTINYLKFDDFKVNCDKIAEKLGVPAALSYRLMSSSAVAMLSVY